MGKVLYAEFIDNWITESATNFGADEPPARRVMQIPLTSEQTEMLKPRKVGTCYGKDVYESVRLLCVQNEQEGEK